MPLNRRSLEFMRLGYCQAAQRPSRLWSVALLLLLVTSSLAARSADIDYAMPSAELDEGVAVSRVAFGSCYKQQRNDSRIWDTIREAQPDLFVYAGDTVYPKKEDSDAALPRLKRAYESLSNHKPFARLRREVPVVSIWDDHDYGTNDGDGSFGPKERAEALFEAAWALEADDPRRMRDGIYHSLMLGPAGKRLQVIMLDTRFFRSSLFDTDDHGAKGKERYLPDDSLEKTMLGEAQWSWLEEELDASADLRLIVSSIQVIADGHGWESWRMLPRERERLFELLKRKQGAPVYLLSGDRHVAGFYEWDIGLSSPLTEFTSSPLNNTIPFPYRRNTLAEAGPRRLGPLYGESNYGTVDIDWEGGKLAMTLWSRTGSRIREEVRQFR